MDKEVEEKQGVAGYENQNFLLNNTLVIKDCDSFIVYCPYENKITRTDKNPKEDAAIYQELFALGFFGGLPSSVLKLGEWKGFDSLTLFLTRECNLSCTYCYASAGFLNENVTMSDVLADNAVDWFLSQLKAERVRITFHGGGEPSLFQDLIKKVFNRVEKHRGILPADYFIVSNGTFGDNFLSWMVEKGFKISISVDGPPEIQDRNRPFRGGLLSSGIVEGNLRKLVAKKYPFTVRVTYSLEDDIEKIVRYFGNLGVKSIHLEPLFPYGRNYLVDDLVKNSDSIVDIGEVMVERFLQALKICSDYKMKINNSHLVRLLNGRGYFCGGASGKAMMVTHDGCLSGCLEVVDMKNKEMDIFKIGEWLPLKQSFVVSEKSVEILRKRHVDNIDECKDCFAKYVCAGGCAVKAVRASGCLGRPDMSYCSFTKKLIPILVGKIAKMSNI